MSDNEIGSATFDGRSARTGFWADVGAAARAMVQQPVVPLVTILLGTLPFSVLPYRQASGPMTFVVMITLLLFWPGWVGAERIFFLRQFRAQPAPLGHLLRLVKPFMGRFLALGLVMTLTFGLGAALVRGVQASPHRSTRSVLTGLLVTVVVDFALTFVTPALAFTTRSVWVAIKIGVGLLRETWPRSALYVLFPPLALGLNAVMYPEVPWLLRLVGAACLSVVALLAKGATAAFYLRERPVPDEDGAAHMA